MLQGIIYTMEEITQPVFQLKTLRGKVFKCLSDSLRSVLTDAHLVIDASSLRLMAVDVVSPEVPPTCAVHLELPAECFETFFCHEKIVRGVSVVKLAKLLGICSNHDRLSLSIFKDMERMEVRVENPDGQKKYIQWISLSDIDLLGLNEFETVMNNPPDVSSAELLRICRQLNKVGCRFVEMQIIDDELTFIGGGGERFSIRINTESVDGDPKHALTHSHEGSIASGVFSLRHLQPFAKAGEISTKVRICINPRVGEPSLLICEYDVLAKGHLRYLLRGEADMVQR
jgi:proliferating cell nuclear antigen PCNA